MDNIEEIPQRLERFNSPELNEILGESFPVLDDGFVRVVDYLGNDSSIVQAARVSYGKGTKKKSSDEGLIRYLMRQYHTTPFEMCEIKFHVRAPMDSWRQWIRTRTAHVNEYSTRYSEAIDSAQGTEPTEWRSQSKSNKQGSGDFLSKEQGLRLTVKEHDLQETARMVYEDRLKAGVAREQARKDLPLSTYTEAYWKVDLHNLLHFLRLRMDSHAQFEIRQYANIIGNEIVSKWCPIVWRAFKDYRLESVTFSKQEKELLSLLLAGSSVKNIGYADKKMQEFGWILKGGEKGSPHRERLEFENKLRSMGLEFVW